MEGIYNFNHWASDVCHADCTQPSLPENLWRIVNGNSNVNGDGQHAMQFFFCNEHYQKVKDGEWLFPYQIGQFQKWFNDWDKVIEFLRSKGNNTISTGVRSSPDIKS